MKSAPIPSDEAQRLARLRSYGVLDTPPEETFDRIVRLAQRLLEAPIVLVSLVDAHRQWFKAKVGLDVAETPREQAFCAHAILEQEVMVVPDAAEDSRFVANPLVQTEPRIRFYVGAPLGPKEGQGAIGTLCALDRTPRVPKPSDVEGLRDLAALVTDELELRRTRRDVERRVAMYELSERVARAGHWFYDRDEKRLEWSQETYRIHGVDPTHHRPTIEDSRSRVHPDDRPQVDQLIEHALRNQEPCELDYRLLRPDGEERRVHARGLLEGAFSDHYVFGTLHDITERHALEEQVRQAERLASIGTLAAGVAHEINNPLTYLQTNLEVLREGAAEDERDELFDEVADGLERIRRIVAGLKTFSRTHPDNAQNETVSLARVVDTAIRLCRNELHHRANLVVDRGLDVAHVRGDEAQLVQVAVNLLLNAGQAIPAGHATEHQIAVQIRSRDDDWVCFQVTDTGAGMDEKTVARAFSPFFTTKSDSEGTGLGLSISHRIIEAHGGHIEVESEVGEGTRVRVLLPTALPVAVRPPSTDPPASIAPEHWRVLVVDDDALVRKALARLLRGHSVDVEHDARRVLERLERGEADYDAIVCDLMMPSMTGWDFHAALEERFPEFVPRLIFLTGGAFTPEGRAFAGRSALPILTKPIDARTLRKAIREVVER